MADHPSLELVPFIEGTFTRSVNSIKQATTGLSDEQLYFQPIQDTNSIAWLAWHLSRRKDYYSSKLVGDEQVWVTEGWYQRFGMTAEETGLGHTPEQVTAFRPAPALLFGYVEAANNAAMDRISRLRPELLDREVELDANRGMRPAWQMFNPMISDCLQHLGQISYLRGVITGRGWYSV